MVNAERLRLAEADSGGVPWRRWNGRGPLLKERLFGLTNAEGNHGKECYFYLDATPTRRT